MLFYANKIIYQLTLYSISLVIDMTRNFSTFIVMVYEIYSFGLKTYLSCTIHVIVYRNSVYNKAAW